MPNKGSILVRRSKVVYPAVMEYFQKNPGASSKQAFKALNDKKLPEMVGLSFNAFSGGISNMVNTGRLTYRPRETTEGDQSIYGVYFKTYNIGKRVQHGHTKRRFRRTRRTNGAPPIRHQQMVATPVAMARVNGAMKVDVQLMIAIGERDTLVGFEVARDLYQQLKGIFEAE